VETDKSKHKMMEVAHDGNAALVIQDNPLSQNAASSKVGMHAVSDERLANSLGPNESMVMDERKMMMSNIIDPVEGGVGREI
jgi:hypothetical protein